MWCVVCDVWLCWLTQVGPNGAQCYHNFSYLCSSPRLSLESPGDYYRHYDNRDDHHADSDRDRHNYADDHWEVDYLGVSGDNEGALGRRSFAGGVIGLASAIISPSIVLILSNFAQRIPLHFKTHLVQEFKLGDRCSLDINTSLMPDQISMEVK